MSSHLERLTSQLLAGPPAHDPVTVAERLLAVQGQDQRGVRLAVRARTTGLTTRDIDRALTEERSLLITWLCRGTLHLIRSEDYPWLQALTTSPLLTGNLRRLAQEGVTADAAERGVAVIERALADNGPMTRVQLRERVTAAGVRTEGQAMIHILFLTSLRGLTVRGPVAGAEQAYVLVRDWLPDLDLRVPDRDQALAELARRYLAGHGPADDRDLARWAGLPLRDARAGLSAIAGELEQRDDGLVNLKSRPRPESTPPPPRLLGAFDPLLLGWVSRKAVLGRHQGVVTVNGIFRPFALAGGRAVATWRMPGGRVVLEPFGRLAQSDAAQLEEDAADVERFLGRSPAETPQPTG